jgi:hypothetical protein
MDARIALRQARLAVGDKAAQAQGAAELASRWGMRFHGVSVGHPSLLDDTLLSTERETADGRV